MLAKRNRHQLKDRRLKVELDGLHDEPESTNRPSKDQPTAMRSGRELHLVPSPSGDERNDQPGEDG